MSDFTLGFLGDCVHTYAPFCPPKVQLFVRCTLGGRRHIFQMNNIHVVMKRLCDTAQLWITLMGLFKIFFQHVNLFSEQMKIADVAKYHSSDNTFLNLALEAENEEIFL